MSFTPEEIALLRSGPEGITKWNELRKTRDEATDLLLPDLNKPDLKGAKLFRARLAHVDLSEANLAGAVLYEANLAGASLYQADLTGADLIGATLIGANLMSATLTDAKLFRADLSGATLTLAELSSANLQRANLTGADLDDTNLSGAHLYQANLSGANLRNAIFEIRSWKAKLRDRVRRLFAWPTVRAFGALQVLTKASYFMLAFVPILAGVWQVVHVWTGHAQRQTEAAVRHLDDRLDKINPTGEQEAQAVADVRAAADKAQAVVGSLHPHLPGAWAWAFFAALAAASGHFVYQVFCPDLLKAKSRDEHVNAEAGSFTHDAPNRDDRLTRALTSLRELAEQVPEQRHPNLVRRHGQAVWIPGELSQFHSAPEPAVEMTTVGEEARTTPPPTTAQAGLMMVAIEEGASAEYELQGRRQRPAAVVAFVLYAIAAALILWLVLGQSWAIVRAAWLS